MFEFEVVTLPAVAFSGTPVWQTVSAIQFGCILIIYNIYIYKYNFATAKSFFI